MRTLLISALAATLVGCSYPLRPQTGTESFAHANGFACFDRGAAGQPIEPKPVSFKTTFATTEIKSTVAAKPSSSYARDRARLRVETARTVVIAAKVEPPASRIPLSPRTFETRLQPASNAAADSHTTRANTADSLPTGGAVTNSNTRAIQEQVTAATAVAERMMLNDADDLVAILMARPEIRAISDLTSKIVAIDSWQSASIGNIRTAIAAAGAAEVQLNNNQTKAIDRVISGEVPAVVLALVSQEAAEGFPDIPGYKIFRIPLSPRSSKARL
jgi:hypothetical protein